MVGIVIGHRRRGAFGEIPEIFLVHDPLLIDDERHDARFTVIGRPGYQAKPADHVAVDDVPVTAAGRMASLAGENLEIVTTVWGRLVRMTAISFAGCRGSERTQRADLAVQFGRPIQPILLARRAGELLRVFQYLVAVTVSHGILALCVHIGADCFQRGQFILADLARQQFIQPGIGVITPAVVFLHQGNWERPVIRSDGQYIRDYFYVEDGAAAYMLLAERLARSPDLYGQAFNFSNELQVSVLELVQAILARMGSDLAPDVRNEASNEIRHQYLSAAKARQLLGWQPLFTLEEGLERTIAWYQEFLRHEQ